MSVPAYDAPRSLEEALALLERLGEDATVLAGGQDVVPLMNQGRLAPRHIVDISRVMELRGFPHESGLHEPGFPGRAGGGASPVVLGALATYTDVAGDPALTRTRSLLADALRQMGGGPQVRHRGTVGGAVCAGQPAYDLPACLVALDAVFVLAGRGGPRRVPASAFFLDAGRTARRSDELLAAIELPPLPAGATSAYVKLKFGEGGYTIAGAAALLVRDGAGVCRAARVVLSGVSRVPQRARGAESAVVGTRLDDGALAAAGGAVQQEVGDPLDDVMAPAGYRRAMAGVMARRALAQAAAR